MSQVDDRNMAFWDELCGSHLAHVLGIVDASPASLKKFDDWFFDFYPYVFEHLRLSELRGLDVLEVGLGYGSVGQKIAESGARYCGLDIATGPVEMIRHRLRQSGLAGGAEHGSILAAPFADRSFDRVISIGCIHHCGDMGKAINECWRVLRPGGSLMVMVYYAYSYRRWMQARSETLRYIGREVFGYRGVLPPSKRPETLDYDHNSAGEAAPHTDFISVKSLRHLCRRFSTLRWQLRNINQEPPFATRTRQQLLSTRWPDLCGLEIYATAVK